MVLSIVRTAPLYRRVKILHIFDHFYYYNKLLNIKSFVISLIINKPNLISIIVFETS